MQTTPKPPRPRAPRPVESFGPEILAALQKGATEGLTIPMSYKLAIRFRLRIHQLRESMRKSGHERYELCSRVRVTIEWPLGTQVTRQGRHYVPVDRDVMCQVHLKPNDTEFAGILKTAGVDPLSAVSEDDIPDEAEVSSSSSRVLDDFLKDLDK